MVLRLSCAMADRPSKMIVCLVPAYRAADSVCGVVAAALAHVDRVIVIDDACPQECGLIVELQFAGDPKVEVLRHQTNRGVGGAMKTGIRRALQLDATFVVKVDADGQMEARHIPYMVRALMANPRLALMKGNRFFDGSVARLMPGIRLLGNSILTLLVRFTTGYWNAIDPTNGFVVIRASVLKRTNLEHLADRYFFEISLLTALGLQKLEIGEIETIALYGNNGSSLSVWKTALSFPGKLAGSFIRRIFWQYFISDMNVGSLFLIFGSLLTVLAAIVGGIWWEEALRSGIPRTPGTVTLVLVPLIMGFQLLLNALLYDVQSSTRVFKFSSGESFNDPVYAREIARV